MKMYLHETEQVIGYFDSETHTARIIYKNIVSPQVTGAVYHWIIKTLTENDVPPVYGCIFDFSQVTEFQPGNIQAARKESSTANQLHDFSKIPTALIAQTPYQEGMIRVSMKLNPDQHRMSIVSTMEEAMRFLHHWHQNNKVETNNLE